MNIRQAVIAPASGVAVVVASVVAFGAAFGCLLGIGLAAIATFTCGLALSGQEASQGASSPSPAPTGRRNGADANSPVLGHV